MIEDKELVSRVVEFNDQHAFRTLVVKYQSKIRSFARRLTAGCYATADDIAQETFLSAFRNIHTFRGHSEFSTWLYTIAHRHFLAILKKNNKAKTNEMSEAENVETLSVNSEDSHLLIEQLMSILSPNERVCISLSSLGGMTHQEISDVCNMPLGTVKSHIKRATDKMQRAVNENSK